MRAMRSPWVPSLPVKRHRLQLLRHLLQRRPQVVLPEELGVGEPGGQDAGVAGEDGGAVVGGLAVGDEDVGGDASRRRIAQREELLVRPHRGLQHLGRQVEEARLDPAHQRHRPFGQAGVLGEKAGVVDQIEPRGERELGRVVGDGLGPRGRIEDDVGALQLFGVVLERGHREFVGRVEAVAARGIAGRQPVDDQRHGLGAALAGQDAEDRVQRPDPAQGPVSPAHRLRPREPAHRRLDGLGDDLGGGASRLLDDGEEHVALLVGPGLEPVAGQAGGPQEPLDRLVGCVGARPLALLPQRGRALGQALERQRQAARRGEGGGVGIGEAALDQPVGDEPLQVRARLRLHAGGDFLGKEFEQEIGHYGVSGRGWCGPLIGGGQGGVEGRRWSPDARAGRRGRAPRDLRSSVPAA